MISREQNAFTKNERLVKAKWKVVKYSYAFLL